MKKYLLLFLAVTSICLTSCSEEDDNNGSLIDEQLKGNWKLSDIIRPRMFAKSKTNLVKTTKQCILTFENIRTW